MNQTMMSLLLALCSDTQISNSAGVGYTQATFLDKQCVHEVLATGPLIEQDVAAAYQKYSTCWASAETQYGHDDKKFRKCMSKPTTNPVVGKLRVTEIGGEINGKPFIWAPQGKK